MNLRELVTLRLRVKGALPIIPPDKNEAFRRSVIQEFKNLAQTHPKVQLVRADLPFYLQDGSIRYSSGRIFYYIDDDHLSQAGTELLRETCHRAIGIACGL
jgi:hypothetical protein